MGSGRYAQVLRSAENKSPFAFYSACAERNFRLAKNAQNKQRADGRKRGLGTMLDTKSEQK